MRRSILVACAVALTGCGSGGSSKADMAGSRDLAGAVGESPDLQGPVAPFRYVTDAIRLPKTKAEYARDVNGDGKAENRLGDVVASLKAINYDLQAQEDSAVSAGDALVLFSFRTTDANLVDDAAAATVVYTAATGQTPDFTGKGTFMIDKSVPPATLNGPLAAGSFSSEEPIQLASPPRIELRINLGEGGSVLLPVIGAHLQFTPSDTKLVSCQLNGAVTSADIDKVLIPGIARSLDKTLKRDPCDSQCMQVKSFDKNKDGSITAQELREDFLVQSLLKPDVDVLDAGGKWKPTRDNADPDALSLGVAFTAVRAKFAEP